VNNSVRTHVDHVGSLVRPKEFLHAFDDYEDGRIDSAQWREIVEDAIRKSVAMQEAIGLPRVTDGEFRRRIYNRAVFDAVTGLEQRPGPFNFRSAKGDKVALMGGYAAAKLKRIKPIVADDFAFLKNIATVTAKATLPSPAYFHFGLLKQCINREVYRSIDEFHDDVVEIYKAEIDDLAAQGCEVVQLDEVSLALLCDPDNREIIRAQGDDPDAVLDMYIRINNEVCRSRPANMTMLMHLCRGNRVGMWAGAGGYDVIAERMFNELEVDGFLLEFDTSRAGSFEPLRHLPADKIAYLGLVSTKNPEIETGESLQKRLEEAARYAPIERLGICPQCGFGASALRGFAHLNPMTEDIQERKLNRMVEVAENVWGRPAAAASML
jgi:5-methyltetrahydropteroyltriglutamate--homocysteine methyltransferase